MHKHICPTSVEFSAMRMEVELNDGRRVIVSLGAFPTLFRATPAQRENWILTHDGEYLSWPEIGQDIALDNIYSNSMVSGESMYA
ncbi:MAG: DUF2442 domain-containing protein [Desulfovibrio sp.]|nr:DUF2442 domain-containing protein [Desulfovibrio sp.]